MKYLNVQEAELISIDKLDVAGVLIPCLQMAFTGHEDTEYKKRIERFVIIVDVDVDIDDNNFYHLPSFQVVEKDTKLYSVLLSEVEKYEEKKLG